MPGRSRGEWQDPDAEIWDLGRLRRERRWFWVSVVGAVCGYVVAVVLMARWLAGWLQ